MAARAEATAHVPPARLDEVRLTGAHRVSVECGRVPINVLGPYALAAAALDGVADPEHERPNRRKRAHEQLQQQRLAERGLHTARLSTRWSRQKWRSRARSTMSSTRSTVRPEGARIALIARRSSVRAWRHGQAAGVPWWKRPADGSIAGAKRVGSRDTAPFSWQRGSPRYHVTRSAAPSPAVRPPGWTQPRSASTGSSTGFSRPHAVVPRAHRCRFDDAGRDRTRTGETRQ